MKFMTVLILTFLNSAFAVAEEKKSVWSNESEAAIVQTTGNSETESYSIKQSSTKKKDKNTYAAKASYLKTASESPAGGRKTETSRQWDAGLRYERAIDNRWSGYLGYKVESNKYAGYQQRHNTDLGAKYVLFAKENTTLFGEGGYRYVHENKVDGTQTHGNAARAYLEVNHKFNDTNSVKAWTEYIPNFEDSKDYQVNSEVSLSSALSTMFSVKIAYEIKTDNKPAGKEKTDTKLTTALVAVF